MTERVKVDPRFRRVGRKATKVVVDKRFQAMFDEKDFVAPVKVDKYGRSINSGDKEDLKRFYHLEEEEDERKNMKDVYLSEKAAYISEEVSDVSEEISNASEMVSNISELSDASEELTSSDSDSEEEEQRDLVMDEALSSHPLVARDVPFGEATSRLALINMDWDQITADDIYVLLYGFKPIIGSISSVTIYPSKFGRERLAREAVEGPPKELFSNEVENSSDRDENEDGVDEIALRKYQLERLRYYYAVIECDSRETAFHIYKNCDGSEFEKSANFLDLRFIPDSTTFTIENDGHPKDICNELPKDYKSKSDLVTSALQNSKVQLTWDADDTERVRAIRRPGKFDIKEDDLKAYLASTESESEDNQEVAQKYRNLLQGDESGNVFGRKGGDKSKELQVTFASALNGKDEDEDEVHMEAEFNDFESDKNSDSDVNDTTAIDKTDKTSFEKYLDRRKLKKKAKKEALKLATEKENKMSKSQKKKKKFVDISDNEKDQLSLLVADVDDDEDVNKRRASKKGKTETSIDVNDSRFSAMFEEPSYALDPSHPSFQKSKGTEKLIKERQRRLYHKEK